MANKSQAQIGKGTQVNYWNTSASPPAYQTLGQLLKVGEIGVEKPEVPSTTLDSEGEESIPGLGMGKNVQIAAPMNATTRALFESLDAADNDIDLEVIYPAPMSVTEYFTISPRGTTRSEITPGGLMQIILNSRMVGARPDTTDPHA